MVTSGSGRMSASSGGDQSQPSLAPEAKRSRMPASVTKMSPSMYIEVILSTAREAASQPVASFGKPPPSEAGK